MSVAGEVYFGKNHAAQEQAQIPSRVEVGKPQHASHSEQSDAALEVCSCDHDEDKTQRASEFNWNGPQVYIIC